MPRCLSWHKDTNFKANHNCCRRIRLRIVDVCLGTKIRILKQITTTATTQALPTRCLSWHKDTNFKANHNMSPSSDKQHYDVCLGTKIRILKQITTNRGGADSKLDVCLGTKIRILKQITTSSFHSGVLSRCLSWHKDTNFKANHN